MTHKTARIREMVAGLEGRGWDARYLGFFQCFNEGLYYESHDVLEDLWLERRGTELDLFYKALIQFAGAFVHLQKSRPGPARALFKLSSGYLAKYPAQFHGLDLSEILRSGEFWDAAVQAHIEQGAPLPAAKPVLITPALFQKHAAQGES